MRCLRTAGVAVAAALLMAGCSGDHESTVPALGGDAPELTRPPATPMNDLERPIAAELAGQVASQGLTLDYLDCPPWNGEAPAVLHCEGYLNGLVSGVRVRLSVEANDALSFDATLQPGIIATKKLVDILVSGGNTNVDCGYVPAYPTKVGSELVCSVSKDGEHTFLVATVKNKSGAVDIAGY